MKELLKAKKMGGDQYKKAIIKEANHERKRQEREKQKKDKAQAQADGGEAHYVPGSVPYKRVEKQKLKEQQKLEREERQR